MDDEKDRTIVEGTRVRVGGQEQDVLAVQEAG